MVSSGRKRKCTEVQAKGNGKERVKWLYTLHDGMRGVKTKANPGSTRSSCYFGFDGDRRAFIGEDVGGVVTLCFLVGVSIMRLRPRIRSPTCGSLLLPSSFSAFHP